MSEGPHLRHCQRVPALNERPEQTFLDYTSPMNRVPENRLVGLFEAISVADRSVAEGVHHLWLSRITYADVRHLKVPEDVDSGRRLRVSNLAAALRWAFAKCPSIDSLTVAEIFQIHSDVLRLPIYQQLRRIRLTGDLCVNKAEHDRFIRALSGPDQSDLVELEYGVTGTSRPSDADKINMILARALVSRHTASLHRLDTHNMYMFYPDSVDVSLPALRHFTCLSYWPTVLLADSVELLTLKALRIKKFFNWPRLFDMEFSDCPRLVDWGPGVSFPCLERLSVRSSLDSQMDELTEISRRAPRLSALSLVADSDFCVRVMHRVIAIIGGQLRRLKLKVLSTKICRPMMSALCGAVALERTEFELLDDFEELMTASQLNEWIADRKNHGNFAALIEMELVGPFAKSIFESSWAVEIAQRAAEAKLRLVRTI